MPASALELLHKLNNEIGHIAAAWKVFEATFNETTSDVIARSAPGFFGVINIALQRDVVLGLARLTDPSTTGKYENISLRALVEALPSSTPPQQADEVHAHLAALEKNADPIRAFRMKYLAHNDLEHGLGHQKLPGTTREAIAHVIAGAGALTEAVSAVISPNSINHPVQVQQLWSAKRLLRLLARGLIGDTETPDWE